MEEEGKLIKKWQTGANGAAVFVYCPGSAGNSKKLYTKIAAANCNEGQKEGHCNANDTQLITFKLELRVSLHIVFAQTYHRTVGRSTI